MLIPKATAHGESTMVTGVGYFCLFIIYPTFTDTYTSKIGVAQWKRDGPITHRSEDRNLSPIAVLDFALLHPSSGCG